MYHVPALLEETLEGLDIKPGGTYVDATFGGGGHSRAILSRLGADGRLLAFDQDEDVLPNVPDDPRFTFVRSNFKYLKNFLRYHGVEQVDGLLADLGVSSHHFDEAERGFSFRFDGELDMRMNRHAALTAAEVLNTYPAERLADVFYLYGELKNARRLAAAVVVARGARAVCPHRPVRGGGEALLRQRQGEEGPGTRVPGLAHRGERRAGSTGLAAAPKHGGAAPRRTAGGHHLPLARRPPGEELHPQRQRRRTGGKRTSTATCWLRCGR